MAVSIFTAFDLVLRRIREWVRDNVQDHLLLPRDQTVVLLEGIDALKARVLVRTAPEPAVYIPQDGDKVIVRYYFWGGVSELPCIFHSIEPALDQSDGAVIGSPDLAG